MSYQLAVLRTRTRSFSTRVLVVHQSPLGWALPLNRCKLWQGWRTMHGVGAMGTRGCCTRAPPGPLVRAGQSGRGMPPSGRVARLRGGLLGLLGLLAVRMAPVPAKPRARGGRPWLQMRASDRASLSVARARTCRWLGRACPAGPRSAAWRRPCHAAEVYGPPASVGCVAVWLWPAQVGCTFYWCCVVPRPARLRPYLPAADIASSSARLQINQSTARARWQGYKSPDSASNPANIRAFLSPRLPPSR